MFNLCFADLVQLCLPLGVLREIIGGARGEEDMSRIATAHYALRDVYSGTGQITSGTALKTKCAFKDGLIRVAQAGEFSEFMLVEKGMTADTAGQLRCRFEMISGEIA